MLRDSTAEMHRREAAEGLISIGFAVLSPNFAHCCKDFCRGARAAQICNLLYRRIAFGGAPAVAKSSASDAASGLQIRDTAE
jgi:hypothetical protein